uniref:von Hippel-Lindau disease tumour suppressor beta domain-containing protein n=1 Tax=Plectus sambesii TaxID=2011161 RepID=A0A914XQ81_9BILA
MVVQVFVRNEVTGNREPLKSGASIVPVYLRLINRTPRSIDLIWINYQGQGVRYATLAPLGHFDVSTYEGHPWVFRDSVNGDIRFALPGRAEIYYPRAFEDRRVARQIVPIVLGVLSLQERALQVLTARLLAENRTSEQNLAILNLPLQLRNELAALIQRCEDYANSFTAPELQANI